MGSFTKKVKSSLRYGFSVKKAQLSCLIAHTISKGPGMRKLCIVVPTEPGYDGVYIYLFGVLRRFQPCTGHITTGSWKGRGNQYIEFARVV